MKKNLKFEAEVLLLKFKNGLHWNFENGEVTIFERTLDPANEPSNAMAHSFEELSSILSQSVKNKLASQNRYNSSEISLEEITPLTEHFLLNSFTPEFLKLGWK